MRISQRRRLWQGPAALIVALLLQAVATAEADTSAPRPAIEATAAAVSDGLEILEAEARLEERLLQAVGWFADAAAAGTDAGEAAMNARAELGPVRTGVAELRTMVAALGPPGVAVPPVYPLTRATRHGLIAEAPDHIAHLAGMLTGQIDAADRGDLDGLWWAIDAFYTAIEIRGTARSIALRAERDTLPAEHPEHFVQVFTVELDLLFAAIGRFSDDPDAQLEGPARETARDAALSRLGAASNRFAARAAAARGAAEAALAGHEALLAEALAATGRANAPELSASATEALRQAVTGLSRIAEIAVELVEIHALATVGGQDPALTRRCGDLSSELIGLYGEQTGNLIDHYRIIAGDPPG